MLAAEAATGEESFLEGLLVEIFGVGTPIEPFPVDPALSAGQPALEVDGEYGRCVAFSPELGKYFVHLFSGHYVPISPECLRLWDPPPPEVGGFDVAWPSPLPGESLDMEPLLMMGQEVLESLARKGWCLIQMNVDEAVREEALRQARVLPDLQSPKTELVADYLGRNGSGKTSVLEYDGLNGLNLQDEPWALADLDRQLTDLAKVVAPYTAEAMSFRSCGRRKGMVWVPFADSAEEARRKPEGLSEEDVEAGVVEAHLKFIRSRRLCLMHWIQNDGGGFTLYPRRAGAEPSRLPLSSGKLLVFRCDEFSYGCEPASRRAASLTTWIMDDELDRQRLMGGHLASEGDEALAEALGIYVGPPVPVGYRTHIMAMHAHGSGDVHDVEECSMLFSFGVDTYIKIPLDRFDTDIYCCDPDDKQPFKSYVCHSAMMNTKEVEMFDNDFFGIPNEEAMFVGANQRVVLQDGYVTLHRAGFARETLKGRNMGVYCGDTGSEFNALSQMSLAEGMTVEKWIASGDSKPYGKLCASRFAQLGVSSMVTANRLSYSLGMVGGGSSVDTACSASLVGVAVATQAFRKPGYQQLAACANKHNEDALCVGISILLTPNAFIGLCGPSMLSPKGRCLTFDVGASGYARGDGFAGAYVKPSDSDLDNVNQIACLVGCAVNQDGRSATLTAPNGMAQQACIRDSMREASLVANQITIGECHGTGTALGDPIEVGAYRGVMEPRDVPLLTTSAKSNIGHLECCAGLMGMLKCCMLVASSTASANVHLHSLNPHLNVDGFPAYFETEASDTRLNSNFAGVSSFGFSGTNARADVWSKCKWGPRRAAKPDMEQMQIHVQCPVTMGLMEFLTGENVTPGFRAKLGYKADVLRDENAAYDISRHAYEGNFRFRQDPDDDVEELDPFDGVFIVGSWTAFTEMEEMDRRPGGWYVTQVVLGECRFESFRLCLNQQTQFEIYPAIDGASERIWIEGPDANSQGRSWQIDGRDRRVAVGTVYEVRFKWHSERKSIEWCPCTSPGGPKSGLMPKFEHKYSLVGTFSSETNFCEMTPDGEGGFEGSFRIGNSCQEEFRIARDNDWKQLIYPAQPQATRSGVPVRGPDHLAGTKAWLVQGPPCGVVKVKLRIKDAHIVVRVSSDTKGARMFRSKEGLDRHEYAVIGSWTDGMPVVMAPDADACVYRAYGRLRGEDALEVTESGYVEAFQIIIDEDYSQAIYPQADGSGSGESIVLGPGGSSGDRSWALRSHDPDARFEICFNPHAVDRRKIVTWSWQTPSYGRPP